MQKIRIKCFLLIKMGSMCTKATPTHRRHHLPWLKSTLRNKRNAKRSLSLNEIFLSVNLNCVAVLIAIYMQDLQTMNLHVFNTIVFYKFAIG